MDKPAVLGEVARVLRADAPFAFTDFIARSGFVWSEDTTTLAHEWGFPSLLRLPDYVALLDEYGFEPLLAEDRTRAVVEQEPKVKARNQQQWEDNFVARHGDVAHQRLRTMGRAWLTLLRAERVGYGLFVCRRRSP